MNNPIIIAYYLPQFYPTIENDKWWGKGFTEWTNVAKAKPLFKGHYQPKIPADLGFYDLRYPEIREQQAELAREAGISAFCYWHYWMGNGNRLLDIPFNEVIKTGKPDFPFCLGWANHDWQRKDWDADASIIVKEILVKQEYGGISDYTRHFYEMLPAFRDKRYFKIDDRLLFSVFRPDSISNTNIFFQTWNDLALKNHIPQFFFVACTVDKELTDKYIKEGYDMVNLSMLNYAFNVNYTKTNMLKMYILSKVFKKVNVINYADAINKFNDPENYKETVAPTIIPNWDHTPRSGLFGTVIHNSTPDLFAQHTKQILKSVASKRKKVIFLKSWNEWGEGNYLEPDLKFGKSYINTLAECINMQKI